MDAKIVIVGGGEKLKKYYHGMSVTPLPPPLQPNCCQQHYIFIS